MNSWRPSIRDGRPRMIIKRWNKFSWVSISDAVLLTHLVNIVDGSPCLSVCTIICQVPGVAVLFNERPSSMTRWEAIQASYIFRWWSLDTDLVSLILPHTHSTRVHTLDSNWQGAKVLRTHTQGYNIWKCRFYGLSMEFHRSSLSLVAISRKIARKMP